MSESLLGYDSWKTTPPEHRWVDHCLVCGEDFPQNEDGVEVTLVRDGERVKPDVTGDWIICHGCLKGIGVEVADGKIIVLDQS